jgi:Animal haem peroxidase
VKKRLLVCVSLAMVVVAEVAPPVGATPSPTPTLPVTPPIPSPQPNLFGRMFPDLPGLTSQTNQELADLASSMLDPNVTDPNPGSHDNDFVPSGDTYFGQFVDHDLTLDSSPSPTEPENVVGEPNGRTFQFDLDSVYGKGPFGDPQLYAADHKHFLVQDPNSNGVRDLPRNPDGTAILVEHRNDENEVISQIHTAFLMFHNRLVDRGMSFSLARLTTISYYQWIVLHEFLPAIAGQDVVDGFMPACSPCLPRFYDPGNPATPMTPLEFSVAAYRFGHSMVRRAYEMTTTSGKIQVFSFTQPDLRGGRNVPAGRQIDWGNFVDALERPDNVAHFNHSRDVDALISSSLFQLPIPPAEASGSNVLAFRNMIRAKFYGLPSGQAVATAMGITPIPPSDLGLASPAFDDGTPLWYYILAESGIAGGKKLGPVGARIAADIFVRLLEDDGGGILRSNFSPASPVAAVPGQFGLADLLVFAGVATRP